MSFKHHDVVFRSLAVLEMFSSYESNGNKSIELLPSAYVDR